MTTLPLNERGIPASRIVLGCMGMGGSWDAEPYTKDHVKHAEAAVEAALEIGINMFDHANIYSRGKAEQVFGEVLKAQPGLREKIIIQSKCGIRFAEGDIPGRYDFSKSHILESVDGILARLGIEYLDILLLHRPDPLMEPEEVAEVFNQLKKSGKVRHFGVSNMSAGQIRLLQSCCDEPFVANQLEMSLARFGWLDAGVHVNQAASADDTFPDGSLEYCRMNGIQIQSWGPLAQGLYSGRNIDNEPESVKATAKLVQKLASQYNTTCEAIVLAWLMRHPAQIQPVIGTVNPDRIRACKDALHITLTREEWYSLYVSTRGRMLP